MSSVPETVACLSELRRLEVLCTHSYSQQLLAELPAEISCCVALNELQLSIAAFPNSL